MRIPSAYQDGYEKARALYPELADAYIENTLVGDPAADAAMESLAECSQEDRHRFIKAGMERDEEGLRAAPNALQEFFAVLDRPPPFEFDPELAAIGSRAFYKYSDMFFVGLVLDSLITGLSEGLAKAFYITGRTAGNSRRVKQNTRHVVEITLPGGMERMGDGWKLTVRIRLIHAQVRLLLLNSDEWDVPTEGVPLNMAHMALAGTGFSAINLRSARKLGVRLTEDESAGFMHIWHYVNWLLGVPESLLYRTEAEALRIREIARACEIPPGEKAIAVAHGYINTVPELLDVQEPAKQQKLLNGLFRVSRALIGNELADTLDFPRQATFGILALTRLQRQFQILRSKIVPGAMPHAVENFSGLIHRSVYDISGISYRMPDAVKGDESSWW